MSACSSVQNSLAGDMNVTPLIDVLLVLLIIFMVITPLTPHGLDALVPQQGQRNPAQVSRAVVLQVLHSADSDQTTLKINDEDTNWGDVEGRLRQIFASRAEKVMFVQGDENVTFDNVAQAIDLARAAGVDQVGLVTAKIAGAPR